MMPTGGVNLDTAEEFLKAGACALGIGGSLVEPKAVASGDLKRIETLATERLHLVSPSRDEAIVLERVLSADPPAKSVIARR